MNRDDHKTQQRQMAKLQMWKGVAFLGMLAVIPLVAS